MIYLILYAVYMKHRMQIWQERLKYDLMINSVMFMQHMTSALSDGYTDQYLYCTAVHPLT